MSYRRCNCGCEEPGASYSPASDPRSCPWCTGTRDHPAASCACGYGRERVRGAAVTTAVTSHARVSDTPVRMWGAAASVRNSGRPPAGPNDE